MNLPPQHLDLYLTEIGEPSDNQLRLVLWEASPGKQSNIDDPHFQIEGVQPLEANDRSRVFELCWSNYVAYVVRNESYWAAEEGEPRFDGNLGQRSNSAFFRYITATTFADDDYPGPLKHWSLSTLNHCVDVISTDPPEIRLLAAEEAGRGPTALNFLKR